MNTYSHSSPLSTIQNSQTQKPQPGEIWELSHALKASQELSTEQWNQLYSAAAKEFLDNSQIKRYVMVVTEPEPPVDFVEEWRVISVMVLSLETEYMSDIDLLIPREISDLEQDILAQTWHIQSMLDCNLLKPVGKRLGYEIYDSLLRVGDYHHGLIDHSPTKSELKQLGLIAGESQAHKTNVIQLFHQLEQAWSDVLTVPIAIYQVYLKNLQFTQELLEEGLQIEQDIAENEQQSVVFSKSSLASCESETLLSEASELKNHDLLNKEKTITIVNNRDSSTSKNQTNLSKWFQNLVDAQWENLFLTLNLATAIRSNNQPQDINDHKQEIAKLIKQLTTESNQQQRQNAAKQLGEIGVDNPDAIQALVSLLRSTSDDETVWIAVESLQKIDPENSAAGIRRVKLLDFGMHIARNPVALAVALVQKVNDEVGVLVQVYPIENEACLPTNLKLFLLSDSGIALREITARHGDIVLQLKFSGKPGEKFSIKTALGEATFRENFVI